PNLEWSPDPGLNWRPHPYQGCALPTELSGLAAVRSVRAAVGAGNGIRTRDIQLGRLTLYQLSYSRLLLLRALWLEGVGFEPTKAWSRQIYSLLPLAAWVPLHDVLLRSAAACLPFLNPVLAFASWPAAGVEPATY